MTTDRGGRRDLGYLLRHTAHLGDDILHRGDGFVGLARARGDLSHAVDITGADVPERSELTRHARDDRPRGVQAAGRLSPARDLPIRCTAARRDRAAPRSAKMLRRVFYVSSIAFGVTEVDIRSIVSSSTIWNRRHDVTGMLVASDRNFAQALEGRPADIDSVMERIRADARHHDIRIQIDEPTSSRRFAVWAMAYVARCDLGDELARLHSTSSSLAKRAAMLDVLARACADVPHDL